MTTVEELKKWLEAHRWDGEKALGFMYEEGQHEGSIGMFIKNMQFFQPTSPDGDLHIAYSTLPNLTLDTIELMSHCGRHVEGITRVTGFLSKTSGWNKGKRGELKDRYKAGQF